MKKHKGSAQSGFTMLEVLVVLVVLVVLGVLLVPEFTNTLERAKLRGMASETTVLMRLARLDAIKNSRPAIVVIQPAGTAGDHLDRVVACPDPNNNLICDADERFLGEFNLPIGVLFRDEVGDLGKDSVDGFTSTGGATPNVAVFLGDGSIRNIGSFRFGDACSRANNVLEVRVEPAATARVEIRKWRPSPSRWEANGDGTANSTGGDAWEWYRACNG
jgi:prepilin-type N-terminal cleavage/methylation domain-containing protein